MEFPVLEPFGGHAIFIDAKKFLPEIIKEAFYCWVGKDTKVRISSSFKGQGLMYKVSGISWSIPAGRAIGLSLSFFYYKSVRWKKKAIVKYQQNE